jgi:hypothetical protein
MTCEFCKGSGETLMPVMYMKSKLKKMASIPCFCLISRLVSQENDLIGYLEETYLHPDKMDSRLLFSPNDPKNNPNFLITGDMDDFNLQIKSLLMKNRFLVPKPRILFSRSIKIVQDFHVPQGNDAAPTLSALLEFDLVIVIFGSSEKNQVLAPCMAQMILTRKDEKKPTWIYLPRKKPTIELCLQEKSAELEEAIKDFVPICLSDKSNKISIKKQTKNTARKFSVEKK